MPLKHKPRFAYDHHHYTLNPITHSAFEVNLHKITSVVQNNWSLCMYHWILLHKILSYPIGALFHCFPWLLHGTKYVNLRKVDTDRTGSTFLWRHQAINWTSVDLSLNMFVDIHLGVMSNEMFVNLAVIHFPVLNF